MPHVGEKMARTRKIFVSSVDNTHDCEYTTIFKLVN
jgi:hypothetical protein